MNERLERTQDDVVVLNRPMLGSVAGYYVFKFVSLKALKWLEETDFNTRQEFTEIGRSHIRVSCLDVSSELMSEVVNRLQEEGLLVRVVRSSA